MHFWLRLINYQTYHIWVFFIKWTQFFIKSTKIVVFYQYGYIDITKNRDPWLVNHGLSIPFFLLQNFYPLSSAIPFDTPVTGLLWTPWSLEWICQSNFLKGVAVPHVTKNQIVTYKQHLLIFFVLFWRWLASKDHNQGQPAVCGFVATFAFNPNLCHFCHVHFIFAF